MTTTTIDRTEEKINLAKEIGMVSWLQRAKEKVEETKLINNATRLNFKVTNQKTTQKKLMKFCWNGVPTWGADDDTKLPIYLNPITFISGVFTLLFGVLFICGAWADPVLQVVLKISLTVLFCSTVIPTLFGFGFCAVSHTSLSSWDSEIPYGAMLAVKEAKELGISNFNVFYPLKKHLFLRLPDPIIVGTKDSLMFEIFHWDDRKIYD